MINDEIIIEENLTEEEFERLADRLVEEAHSELAQQPTTEATIPDLEDLIITTPTTIDESTTIVNTEFTKEIPENSDSDYDEEDPDDEKSEVIFSVGGDGTLLRAIHTYIDRLDEIQFVAIHTGNLGFFTDYTQDEVDHLVYDLKHNQPKIEEFNLLQAALNIEPA